VFQQIDVELQALRAAILAANLAGVKRHTAAIGEQLDRLQLVTHNPSKDFREEIHLLHSGARCTFSLLQSARRTIYALMAVYRSYSPSLSPVVTEPR